MMRSISLAMTFSLACGSSCSSESQLELLLRSSGDLRLTSAQITTLDALREQRDARNAPLFARLNSMLDNHMARSAWAEHRSLALEAMSTRHALLDSVRYNDEAADRLAVALLTPEQVRVTRAALKRACSSASRGSAAEVRGASPDTPPPDASAPEDP